MMTEKAERLLSSSLVSSSLRWFFSPDVHMQLAQFVTFLNVEVVFWR